MSARHLLYLTDDELQAWAWQAGRLELLASFARNDDGSSEFGAFLARHRRHKLLILSDLACEMQLTISIPVCRGRDRQQLISRQLARHFPASPLRQAISLGTPTSSVSQEQLLLQGFGSHTVFAPWLDQLSRQESWLAGIYSVTQIAQSLLKKARITTPQCLLFTHQGCTLRQSQLVNGQTRYSRVVIRKHESPAEQAEDLLDEVEKMQRYLVSLENWSRNSEHSILIIDDNPASAQLVTKRAQERGLEHTQVFDCQTLGKDLGLDELPLNSGGAALFLHLLADTPPSRQFADDACLRSWRAQQQIRQLGTTALLATLTSCLFALPMHLEAQALSDDSRHLEAAAQQLAQAHTRLQQPTTFAAIAPGDLLELYRSYSDLRRRQGNPDTAFRLIARALDQHPELELTRLDWEIAPTTPPSAAAGQTLQEITTAHLKFAVDLPQSTKTTGNVAAFIARLQRSNAQFTITQAAAPSSSPPGFRLEIRRNLEP